MKLFSICLSLFGHTEEISGAIRAASDADLFEIRMDLSPPLDCSVIRSSTSKPLIFTAHGNPEALVHAAPFANYLDVGQQDLSGSQYIVSVHARDENPENLWKRWAGDHLTKIVLDTDDYEKISQLLQLNRKRRSRAICFAMGETGAFSRILAPSFGAPWMYSCLPNRLTAPGQFSLSELSDRYRIKRFTSKPEVFGIVGNPVSHSRSPEFHNRRFSDHSLPWIYLPFYCTDLPALLQYAREFRIVGLSITHPYKEEVLPFLQHVSQEALQLRSCNTICYRDGAWHGTNTDVVGVSGLLERHEISLQGSRVVILGAGGSARAIASVIRKQVRQLTFLNRTVSKARELALEFEGAAGSLEELALHDHDVLFQATSVGLNQGECPVDVDSLRKGSTVVDVIYEPAETLLLKAARKRGCRTINGESWFAAQAEAQFSWWQKMLRVKDSTTGRRHRMC